ncbi:chemotaxis protein CheW [Ramlibacter sp. 2FC]|uniref:chemotaxis protein CheA n=1 Tax=Ramlibacter sp. 2FC TaxID=2502188 RepID=UPI0010F79A0A|nr:chemotaxis protein CheW [Ramlibacter sp. 2FC]
MTTEGAQLGASFDLSQFYQVFFEEAGENLDRMEQLLLALDVAAADDEALNAIFRCAHSIKGGAATFGFGDVAELTHEMETLLDKLRRHELQPATAMVDCLLACGDALKAQLARHQNGVGEEVEVTQLLSALRALVQGQLPPTAAAAPAPVVANREAEAVHAKAPAPPEQGQARSLELVLGPLADASVADSLAELFTEIEGLGRIEPLDGGQAENGLRRFKLVTTSLESELLDLFAFHVAKEQVRFQPLAATPADSGLFEPLPERPPAPVAPETAASAAPRAARAEPRAAASPEASTLRVAVEKVDQLINLVGELVITQAMLAQKSRALDPVLHQQMLAGLTDLDRNTRDLQEAVMSIRMIPMSTVFNRFPRMLRDLAGRLGKKVELLTQGEATELDKGLIEKITDPLTHLVRNACDHGIESPQERLAAGKLETGTITLSASHQGGSIVIEVRDDGRGLSRDKLLRKARERGLAAPDTLSDAEVWALIFEPGFSTAEQITDVSGRGVGMDVVKKNIAALSGTVEIDARPGQGMRVSVRLPLTLAIMDGMSVRVGDECYILPLPSVVESFQVAPEMVKTVGTSGRVVDVRSEYLPVVDLDRLFEVPRSEPGSGSAIMVVVEAEGGRVALMVDELLGQQQVVVKNLETNYRRVSDISGATIMGDGRVALILDVGSLVRRTRQ